MPGVIEKLLEIYDETEKRLTAQAIKEVDADIIALQEVENLLLLDMFNARYLAGQGYRHRLVIDGNDPRQIDIAVLSRFPLRNLRTHRHERNADNTAPLFSRDCLEVEFDLNGKVLTVYVNHFKSMIDTREETYERRLEQVQRVAELIDAAWKPTRYQGNFVVLGDFNDYLEGKTALKPLVAHPQLVNLVDRLPAAERWTHYFAGGKRGEKTKQLDYLLPGKAFDKRAGEPKPGIMRKGLPYRAEDYSGPRFDGVGENEPKASDHCPLFVDIPFSALT
ncbi:MAG: endonuclease/exonuclease/phosphatase family protein [Candidatus Competibacteraceae bacterium]